jgi:beta-glucosidase
MLTDMIGGRNYETYSEDPVVLGELAAAYVNGCQEEGIAATPKHFVANEAENFRTKLSVEVDEQTLREIYLHPFQIIMKKADPWCFMSSYNKVNGEYVADSHRLLQDILRDEWGFQGLIMSDWMGTYSTAKGVNAGVELEMPGPTKWRGGLLLKAVHDGQITISTIDQRAEKVLELLKRLGRFENPEEPPERAVEDRQRDDFIAYAAAEGMVLLKNKDSILPIPKGESVALIGHFAEHVCLGGGGSARVDALHAITPFEGMTKLGYKTTLAPGIPIFGAVPHADASIVFESCKNHPSERPVKLEWFNGPVIGDNLAESEMRPNAEYMIKEQWPSYLDKVSYCTRMKFDLVAPSTGHHIFSVISTGPAKCYIDGDLVYDRPQENDLKLESFYFFKSKLERRFNFHMKKGQRYSLKLESWACDPKILNAAPLFGKMFQGSALRFHEHIDEHALKQEAADVAGQSKYAVVFVGNTAEIESEGFDRDTMDLQQCQYDLIRTVRSANPRTIVVNFTGSVCTMTQFVDDVPAIVQGWFPGQESGHSIAAVLSGIINPSGRLPISWPRKLEDNPSYGNFPVGKDLLLHYEEGLDVGYRHYDRPDRPDPLFEFGFGLSYTTFTVADARPQGSSTVSATSSVIIDCEVENTGDREGKVVVQYYVKPPKFSFGRPRPLKELKAFRKVSLRGGERRTISVELDKYAVSGYDAERSAWYAAEGEYEVLVGLSSREMCSTAVFLVAKTFGWTGV